LKGRVVIKKLYALVVVRDGKIFVDTYDAAECLRLGRHDGE
jgi:hypothetical protein